MFSENDIKPPEYDIYEFKNGYLIPVLSIKYFRVIREHDYYIFIEKNEQEYIFDVDDYELYKRDLVTNNFTRCKVIDSSIGKFFLHLRNGRTKYVTSDEYVAHLNRKIKRFFKGKGFIRDILK
ncbi:hypothetical protein [Paenibacillus sp. MER 99-2]|uniref:hypothetical protein n=1 Tax=Paenibacillus sp. MER 99-2 TaxID=2939572 RepID=UPI00203BAC1D|nr:hypothetical protein [Paenibacillus sp. MER 99-2]MCM3173242.1 hypothetical protein [Paenibacillus sp. MER 99-2]